jgi:ABC-type nitrate/sulfonate/bicarbonate transport system permease component
MKGDEGFKGKDAESKKRWKKRFINLGIVVLSLSAFTAVWWLISWFLNTEYLPPPPEVFRAFIESFYISDPNLGNTMGQNIVVSSWRFVGGFLLALIIAVPLGLLMGFLPFVNTLSKPIIELLRPIPPIAWVPFFFVAAGLFWNPILTVFIGAFFPILTNVILGVRSVEPSLLDAARTQGARKSDLFAKVILPFSVPYLMTGITIGLGVGWMCIVAAEWYGAVGGGVGYYIIISGQTAFYANMFAGMIVIALLGIATVTLSGYLESLIKKRMGMK